LIDTRGRDPGEFGFHRPHLHHQHTAPVPNAV